MASEQSVMAVIRASRPSFRNQYDKVAFAIHASFLANGYVLNATGPPAFSDDALTSASNDEVGMDHWNEFEDNYGFVYTNSENPSKKMLVKCLAMNHKLLVDALSNDTTSQPVHLEISVSEYVGENTGSNYSLQYKDLGKLVTIIDKEIFKSGSSSHSSRSETRDREREGTNQPDVGYTEPQNPRPHHPSGVVVPPVYPGIGGSDLFPGPGAGMYPTRDDFGAGGMLLGPNDPRFFGIGGGRFPGVQPGVPPGARFDPYGPPGVPGFEPGRFVRDPRGPRGGNHPDLEHFRDGSDFI